MLDDDCIMWLNYLLFGQERKARESKNKIMRGEKEWEKDGDMYLYRYVYAEGKRERERERERERKRERKRKREGGREEKE